MTRQWTKRVVLGFLISAASFIQACGGGGGGSNLSIRLVPDAITANIDGGEPYTISVVANVTGSVTGAVYVLIVDPEGILDGEVPVLPITELQYSATLTIKRELAGGRHQGNFSILVCADSNCERKYASENLPYDITVTNPQPVLSAINARRAAAGCDDFDLYVVGDGFVAASTVQWNGAPRPTTFVSPKLLSAQISAEDISVPGSATVVVQSPSLGGGSSSGAAFLIDATAPVSSDYTAYLGDALRTSRVTTACPFGKPTVPYWRTPSGSLIQPPLVVGEKVFMAGQRLPPDFAQYSIAAYDLRNGQRIWTFSQLGSSTIVYNNGAIFASYSHLSSTDDSLAAFDAATGTILWDKALDSGASHSMPAAAYGRVVIKSSSGRDLVRTAAYSESDGELLWTVYSTQLNQVNSASVTITPNAIFSCGGSALSPETGATIWSITVGTSCGDSLGGDSVIANGRLYLPGAMYPHIVGSKVPVVDPANGNIFNEIPVSEPPLIGEQTGYFMVSGTLNARSLATNAILWTKNSFGEGANRLLINDSLILINSHLGALLALDAQTGETLWSLENTGGQISIGNGVLVTSECVRGQSCSAIAYRLSPATLP